MVVALCAGCGEAGGGIPPGEQINNEGDIEWNGSWRLVHTEALFPNYWRGDALAFIANLGDHSLAYGDDNEIERIDSYYIAPKYFAFNYSNNQITNFRTITWDEIYTLENELDVVVLASSLEQPYFIEGEVISSVEFLNTSASDWTQVIVSRNKTWESTSADEPCDGEIIKSTDTHFALIDPNDPNSGLELIEENIERCIITTILTLSQDVGDWGETLIDETIEPPTNILSIGASDIPSLPKPEPTVREFNTNGQLRKLTQFTVADSNNAAPSIDADLTYNAQNQLSLLTIKKTDYYFNQTADGLEWFNSTSVFETRYHSPSPGLVIAEIYQVTASGSLKINEVTATYENQPCGPLTQERDRHQLPALFPLCL